MREIEAIALLSPVKQPDRWFGLRYSMNLYRGCQHRCIYCDSRSLCYQIEDFDEVQVKANAIDLLRRELAAKRSKGTIGTGSMSDPYMPVERDLMLTQRALQLIAEFGFPLHVMTKSDLVLRDLDLLRTIGRVFSSVTFTITTVDDQLGSEVEPGAPLVSTRFAAMGRLAAHGVQTGVAIMPILPLLEDTLENVEAILRTARDFGATYATASFGVTLRDRQRAYFLEQLDRLYPGMRAEYERRYGDQYFCPARGHRYLEQEFDGLCESRGLKTGVPHYRPERAQQLRLL
ncbi:MAG: radical SAM protein [Chloroflexi bacterium]|nr:radical SAM protein [Chloroflexota bacterium]